MIRLRLDVEYLLYHDPSIPITQNNPNQLINNRSHVLPVAALIEHWLSPAGAAQWGSLELSKILLEANF